MEKLSVVVMTFNEERNIGRCLNSVKDIADEIVVVDSFSTDKTEEICKSFNARFITHPFEGYIEQRNWAVSQASNDKILAIDADEAVSEKLRGSIKKVKENWTADGYYFNRLNNYCGKWLKHSGWYPDRKLRLLDRRKGSSQGTNPHDKYQMDEGSTTKQIKGDLLHYSYYYMNEHILQLNKFAEIAANEYFEKKKKATFIKILSNPTWKFFRNYFIKLGFLDGYYGFIVCVNAAYYTFLKYAKLKELYRQN